MNIRTLFAALLAAIVFLIGHSSPVFAEGAGQNDFDEALRTRTTGEGLRDLSAVIEMLESAIEKGLDIETNDFAEQMLSGALFERAAGLVQLASSRPTSDQQVKQIARLAESDLRKVLAYDTPPPVARLMLAKIRSLPDGDPHETRRLLDKFLKEEKLPENQRAEALALRGSVQRTPEKALADFDEAIKLAPDNMSYALAKAVYLSKEEKYDEALAAVETLVAQHSDNIALLILQGELLRKLSKNEAALAVFDAVDKQQPDLVKVYQNRGEIYRLLGEKEKAIEQYNKVLELQPEALFTRVQRAEAYLSIGKKDEALADVDTVLEKQPGLIAAHRMRAEILAGEERLDEAITTMQKLVKAVPDQPELQMQLGTYYYVSGQMREAIDAYTQVLLADPKSYLALRSRGDAYLNQGEHALAVADFNAALEIQQDDAFLLNNFAWVLATSPDDAVRDGKRAVELATKACEQTDFKAPHILSTLAAAHAEAGDFEAAINWSQKAVDMKDPQYTEELEKELASYREGKPFRERKPAPPTASPEATKVIPQPVETPASDSEVESDDSEESETADGPDDVQVEETKATEETDKPAESAEPAE